MRFVGPGVAWHLQLPGRVSAGRFGTCKTERENCRSPIFARRAAQSYRDARSSVAPHPDYESLMRLGQTFKRRATAARARLTRMRDASLLRVEAERRGPAPSRAPCADTRPLARLASELPLLES